MKFFSFLAVLCVGFAASAQHPPPGYSFSSADLEALPVLDIGTFRYEDLMAEALELDKRGGMSLYGKIISFPANEQDHGTWTVLENGDRIWQLRFRSEGARALNVFFDRMFLPQGSELYIYSPDRLWFEGPYRADENEPHGHFVTAEAFGDEAILEYYEPAGVVEKVSLGIRGFGHFFRFIQDMRDDRGGSQPCEVDVNCPEGDDWENERQAVVRLSIPAGGGIGLCTGTLVNNTGLDCRNFILTAYHCTIESSSSDLLDLAVRFNYQRSGCGTGSVISTQQRVGTFGRANSNDGGGNTGSDFALLEMEDDIPSSYNPYYAGWDATGSTPTTGPGGYRVVCIHHPNGDVKKISTSNSVASGTWGAANHHWRVEWMETVTNWGVTEGGSSGSPIFNRNRRIVGTLTGGGSTCSEPNFDDYFGKMDRHWDGNPNAANQDLEDWLDPENIGSEILDGAFVGSSPVTPCGDFSSRIEEFGFEDVRLFPALASEEITLTTTLYGEIREVRIFASDGRMVDQFRLGGEVTRHNVSAYSNGIYYVTFIHENGSHVTRKFTVGH